MATRSTGKKTARGGTNKASTGSSKGTRTRQGVKTATSVRGGSGKKTDASPSSGKRAAGGGKSPGKPRPRNSAAKSRSAKKKRVPVSPFLGKYRSYLLGLTLGLVLGCLSALIVVYYPRNHVTESKKQISTSKPVKPAPVKKTTTKVIYEEPRKFETQVKKLDHGLYAAIKVKGVPDQSIHFKKVIPRKQDHRVWDYSLMEIQLPGDINEKNLTEAIRSALERLDLHPTPKLNSAKIGENTSLDITYNGLKTHTIVLMKPTTLKETVTLTPTEANRPKVAIVIDDFGLTLDEARCFLNIDLPLTFSVLPFLDHSIDIAKMAHNKGREVILHLPMQPLGWPEVNAGPGVLLVSMDEQEIRARTKAALKAVPFCVGVNNHMGSRFTEDTKRIRWVLEELKPQNLFFLDSMTSNRSVAKTEAQKMGVPVVGRSTFLDNIPESQAIQVQIKKLIAQAKNNGGAIGIGHVYPITCQALKKEYNYLTSEAMVVPLTALIH